MKLLNAHIENFGTLSNYDYIFSDGLNTIYEPNGFGKTTFATFIKVMFYGFTRTSSQNININERKKYEPWNGGRYGGYLEFEYNHTKYRVTRFFGKSLSKDTVEIYDLTNHTNQTSFGDSLGENIFGLDMESFARSTYLPQNHDKGIFSSTSIHTKLSHLLEDTNDLNNYDSAVNQLKNKRTEIKKYKGSGGLLSDVEEKIVEIESNLSSLKQQEITFENKRKEDEDLLLQIEKLKNELQQVRKEMYQLPHIQVEKEKLNHLQNTLADLKTELEKLDKKYAYGYPDQQEISNLKSACNALDFSNEKLQLIQEENHDSSFNMDDQDLKEDKEILSRQVDLCNHFTAEINKEFPSEEDFENCLKMIQDYELKQKYLQDNTNSKKTWIAIIVAIVLIMFSIVLFAKDILNLYIFIMTVVAVILCLVFFISRTKPNNKKVDKYKKILEKEEKQLNDFFAYYIKNTEEKTFEDKYNELVEMKKERNKNTKTINELQISIQSILQKYQIKNVDDFYSLYKTYEKHIQKKEIEKESRQQLQKQIDDSNEYISLFLQKYHLEDYGNIYEAVNEDIKYKESLLKDIEKMTNEINELQQSNPDIFEKTLDAESSNEKENDLQQKYNQLINQKANLESEIKTLQEQLDKKWELTNTLHELIDERNTLIHKCDLIDKTIEYLTKAKEKLSNRYIYKIEKSFMKYMNMIVEGFAQHSFLDTDLNLRIEENGQMRKMENYSTGIIGCIDLCMRLALVDALFEGEQPFLILDDPFVDFDDMHLQEARKLIKEIAKNKQIIYFVCHSSRC